MPRDIGADGGFGGDGRLAAWDSHCDCDGQVGEAPLEGWRKECE